MTILYKEWRAKNNNFWNGLFTGGTPTVVYSYVHDYLDIRLRNYYIDEEDFTEDFKMLLLENEFVFYNELYKLIDESLKTVITDKSKVPHNYRKYENNSIDDNTSNSSNNASGNSNGNSNGSNEGKTRSLSSTLPHSNVKGDLKPIDTPISWEYATNMADGFNKGNTSNESSSSNTSESESRSTSNHKGKYDGLSEFWREVDIEQIRLLNITDFNEPFNWLVKRLLKSFEIFL